MRKIIRNYRGLAFKMMIVIFLSIAAIFIVIFIYNYTVTRKTVIRNLEINAAVITERTVAQMDKILTGIQKVPQNYVRILENIEESESLIRMLIYEMVDANPEVYGAAIAFEPYYKGSKNKYNCLYAYQSDDKVKIISLGDELYDYFTEDWYQIPKVKGTPYWSEPYYYEGEGRVLMSTYSIPIFRVINGERRFTGVITADISLDWLQDVVKKIKVYKTGFGFLISHTGSIVTHPVTDLAMNESIFSLAEFLQLPDLREIGRNMIHGKSGFFEKPYHNILYGKLSYLAYAPIPTNKWSVGVLFPVDELMADMNKMNRMIILLGLAGLIVIFVVILLISRSITSPLRKLTIAVSNFAEGNFEVELPNIKSRDEIARLTTSFAYMQRTLAETIHNLRETSDQLKVSNEKLEDYSRTLEQKVEERTAELLAKNRELDTALTNLRATQDQLVQSEKLASLGQLTAGIAHEIKNPLNFVNNFSEVTLELIVEIREELRKLTAVSSGPQKEYEYLGTLLTDIELNVRKISEHGKRADSIIRGMLLHSRGKAGERQPTDINAMLAEYINLGYHGMRATDPSFNIKIESDYDPDLGMIEVVPQNISRVFLNIINNACYSTAQKKKELKDAYFPVLRVRTRDLGSKVEVSIHDNGKGIPPQVMDKIFNPFFTTKPSGSGTGLGLSISYDIVVQEHHGEIKVNSKEGEYAEFIVILPK
jgi:signal transduction histidine kinase